MTGQSLPKGSLLAAGPRDTAASEPGSMQPSTSGAARPVVPGSSSSSRSAALAQPAAQSATATKPTNSSSSGTSKRKTQHVGGLSQGQLAGALAAGGALLVGVCALLARRLLRRGSREAGDGSGAGGKKGRQANSDAPGPCSHLKATSKCVPLSDGSACVVRREIAADNSCLFNAVGYVMHKSRTRAPHLRNVVAQQVSGDPNLYSTAFLGMTNAAYCQWIQQPFNWGGGIELSILAQAYGMEIAAWNIESKQVHVFGEESGYKRQAMVIYNGVHYDALAVAKGPKADPDDDETDYNPRTKRGKMIAAAARKLVELTHKGSHFYGAAGKGKAAPSPSPSPTASSATTSAGTSAAKGGSAGAKGGKPKAAGAATGMKKLKAAAAAAAASAAEAAGADTAGQPGQGPQGPKLRCGECGAVLAGAAAAAVHARETGHSPNFEEVAA